MLAKTALPKKITHTEKELLRLAANGNEVAFIEIYNLYKNKLYSFLLRITKSEEESLDFVQDIFMKLWVNRINLASIDNFSNYIFRAAQNKAINSFKRCMTENCILKKIPVVDMAVNSIEADLEYKLLQTKLNEVVKKLPPQQRLVYTLSREKGLKNEEIAKHLNLSVYTIKNHLVQALKTIKDFLRSNLEIDSVLLFILCRSIWL